MKTHFDYIVYNTSTGRITSSGTGLLLDEILEPGESFLVGRLANWQDHYIDLAALPTHAGETGYFNAATAAASVVSDREDAVTASSGSTLSGVKDATVRILGPLEDPNSQDVTIHSTDNTLELDAVPGEYIVEITFDDPRYKDVSRRLTL